MADKFIGSAKNVLALAGVVIKELYRRKDFYVLFVLTALITFVLGSVNLLKEGGGVRYLKDLCLVLIWICGLVIALVTAARQIPMERESRTIFPLLAKPVTRADVVLGKFLGCWVACGIALVTFYAFFVLMSGSREHTWPIQNCLQALWLHWCMLAVVVAMAVWGSVVFAAPSSTVTILLVVVTGILLVGRHLHKVAMPLAEPIRSVVITLYFAIPHLEFFDVRDLVIHDLPGVPWTICGLATLYAMAYTAVFLSAAWLVFRRQSLS